MSDLMEPKAKPVTHGPQFRTFMAQREAAARDYTRGKAEALDDLLTRRSPASFFGPDGSVTQEAQTIRDTYRNGAKSFGLTSETHFEILQMGSGGDIAYWTGLQHAVIDANGDKTPMTLRVTELYRREDGNWKLVHRHADALKA